MSVVKVLLVGGICTVQKFLLGTDPSNASLPRSVSIRAFRAVSSANKLRTTRPSELKAPRAANMDRHEHHYPSLRSPLAKRPKCCAYPDGVPPNQTHYSKMWRKYGPKTCSTNEIPENDIEVRQHSSRGRSSPTQFPDHVPSRGRARFVVLRDRRCSAINRYA